ncbi:hypothetical protein GCM10009628_10600 [Paeniglutamicibacter kerguelensis]
MNSRLSAFDPAQGGYGDIGLFRGELLAESKDDAPLPKELSQLHGGLSDVDMFGRVAALGSHSCNSTWALLYLVQHNE